MVFTGGKCNVSVIVSVQSHRVQQVVVRSPGRVKLNNMVAATIQLSMQHSVRAKTNLPGIQLISSGVATKCLSADCCCNELALYHGLVHSG